MRHLAPAACFTLVFAAGGLSAMLLGAAVGDQRPTAAAGIEMLAHGPDESVCLDVQRNKTLRRADWQPANPGGTDANVQSATLMNVNTL